MSLPVQTLVHPNQQNQSGSLSALAIEEYINTVEGTLERERVLGPFMKLRTVKGTNVITSKSIGKATLQGVTPGTSPDGVGADVSKLSLTVNKMVLARNIVAILEDFQTDFNVRSELAVEQGKEHAKFMDQAYMIQAIKAAELTASPYGSTGHFGGTNVTIATADKRDPAKIYDALCRLLAGMAAKDVTPSRDGVAIVVTPETFYDLLNAEQIVNGEYITSNGTKIEGVMKFKAFGVPVVASNDLPRTNITTSLLGAAYTGDFTNVLALAFSDRALLCGQTIPLTSKVHWSDVDLVWYVDSYAAYGMTPNRPEFAGVVTLV